MPAKLTYEHVKSFIESVDGYELLSDSYVNNREKLQLICPNGHIFEMIYGSFKQGQRCPVCLGGVRLSYEQVKSSIESVEGYKLLSTEYKNNREKLLISCSKNHLFEMCYSSFCAGQKCPICQRINSGIKRRLIYDDVKNLIESNEGYKLLSCEYESNQKKLKIQCPKKHIFEMSYNSFKRGQRCPICQKKMKDNKLKHSYKYVKNFIKSIEGYKLISTEYINSHEKIAIECPKKHIFEMSFNCFKGGQRCPICSYEKGQSLSEIEIFDYVKQIYDGPIIQNDRTQIINPITGYNLELDVWLPKLNKAIEYNGRYWHSINYQKIKDKIKLEQCKEKGIDLLIINEDSWLKNKDWSIIDKYLHL